ncbi:MAG: hypothetical protein NXI10_10610 [bacterium]|nr:hypothetical protein [bacterium]
MSALKSVCFLLLISLTVAACSSSETKKADDATSEQLPKVDTSKFREFKGDGFRLQLLKSMSWNEVSGFTLFDAEFLPKEYHINITAVPASYFKNDNDFPRETSAQLKWLAKKEADKIIAGPKKAEVNPVQSTSVNKKSCLKQTIHGFEYGFPKRKTFYFRYYKIKNTFVTIKSWTISENAKDFETLAQYMGMTFELGN